MPDSAILALIAKRDAEMYDQIFEKQIGLVDTESAPLKQIKNAITKLIKDSVLKYGSSFRVVVQPIDYVQVDETGNNEITEYDIMCLIKSITDAASLSLRFCSGTTACGLPHKYKYYEDNQLMHARHLIISI